METRDVKFVALTTPDSLAVVRDIAAEIWPETFRAILPPEQIPYMMKMMYAPEVMERELSSGYAFDLLTVDGKDAGYMVYSPTGEPGTMKLHKLYLLSEYHGCGCGQKMLQHVISISSELGYRSVILAVNKQNYKAQKAYKRFGFILEKSVCVDIGNGFFMDDYLFRFRMDNT